MPNFENTSVAAQRKIDDRINLVLGRNTPKINSLLHGYDKLISQNMEKRQLTIKFKASITVEEITLIKRKILDLGKFSIHSISSNNDSVDTLCVTITTENLESFSATGASAKNSSTVVETIKKPDLGLGKPSSSNTRNDIKIPVSERIKSTLKNNLSSNTSDTETSKTEEITEPVIALKKVIPKTKEKTVKLNSKISKTKKKKMEKPKRKRFSVAIVKAGKKKISSMLKKAGFSSSEYYFSIVFNKNRKTFIVNTRSGKSDEVMKMFKKKNISCNLTGTSAVNVDLDIAGLKEIKSPVKKTKRKATARKVAKSAPEKKRSYTPRVVRIKKTSKLGSIISQLVELELNLSDSLNLDGVWEKLEKKFGDGKELVFFKGRKLLTLNKKAFIEAVS